MRLLIFLALSLNSFQREGPTLVSAIEGIVTTDGGGPLAAVKITVDSLIRPSHFETRSDKAGHYAIEHLTPGNYEIVADARGIGCIVIPKVTLQAGQRLRRNFEMLRSRKNIGCPID